MKITHWRRASLIMGCLLGLLIFLYLAGLFPRRSGVENSEPSPSLSLNLSIEEFFGNYWQTPIPPQGSPPTRFTDAEASLQPEACGSCHPDQYRDWKESLHSMAMGPGPWGQIIDLNRSSPQEGSFCMTCHAPLSEQMPLVAKTTAQGKGSYEKNPRFDSQLQLRGITCAACHVRQHQRFGPPKAEGDDARRYPSNMPNHGGVQRTPYFERAEFCRGCHQFDPENTLLVNGKPMQDTYREWKNSIWGKDGAACQECHMPGRRHLWKGIHDPEMVKGGVRIEAQIKGGPTSPDGPLEVEVEVTNAAVGHKFPSYITPKVFVRAVLLGESGSVLPGTQQEATIGWDVRSDTGQWKEYFDTRVAPGKSFRHTFKWARTLQAQVVRVWIEVHPDYFYNVHFYPAYLNGGGLSPEGRKLVEKALSESGRTSYILFEKRIPLN
ncbi:MAG: ammonia-forming cytochrome c nitrite reductase subunit c552 [Deltaproteobacteria bacterium]|nr:ammonia-forming cytochrome c nitrite reductase subunit c552 [Deltaproteobacteria bacterium]